MKQDAIYDNSGSGTAVEDFAANIRTACEGRKIQGAVRFGRSWLIPQSAQLHLEEGKISAVPSASERWYQQRLVESQSEWQQFIEIH